MHKVFQPGSPKRAEASQTLICMSITWPGGGWGNTWAAALFPQKAIVVLLRPVQGTHLERQDSTQCFSHVNLSVPCGTVMSTPG